MQKMHKTSAQVVEVQPGGVRLRVGMPGHQHRILSQIPDGEEAPYRRALEAGTPVSVWIEVPDVPADS